MKYKIIWCLLGLMTFSLMSCGAGSQATTTNTSTSFTTEYIAVDIGTGTVRTISTSQTSSATTVIFKRLASGNYLSVSEVSRENWNVLMGTTPWAGVPANLGGPSATANLPANNLSFDDASAFAAAAAQRTGRVIGLPSLAEFQSAFGAGLNYPWGNGKAISEAISYAVMRESGLGLSATQIRSANNGYYDLIGNVREWTADSRLIGGSWNDNMQVSRLSNPLSSVDPGVRHPLSGARIALRQ